MTEIIKIIGSPGTGKTSKCIEVAKNEIDNGLDPDDLVYMSFTKAASNEAKERIAEKTEKARNDIQKHQQFIKNKADKLNDEKHYEKDTNVGSLSTTNPDEETHYPTQGEKDGSSSFVTGAADRNFDLSKNQVRTNARVTGYGEAEAYSRLYFPYNPGEDGGPSGNVSISIEYFSLI